MKRLFLIFVIIIFIVSLVLSGCSIYKETNLQNDTEINEEANPIKSSESFFHYQLQNADFLQLKNLNVDYLVVDFDDVGLSNQEILSLQEDGKIVLSYLSIGEAENYRNYWEEDWKVGNPEFIDSENPDWEGNFKVKYWYPEWQEIILQRVKDISVLGYDGVYLDIIDAYDYYKQKGIDDADERMINFVDKIKSAGGNNFLIVPQNAVELYEDDDFKEIIDGFGKEDTWFDDNNIQNQRETNEVLSFLNQAIEDGKFVLAIDYPSDKDKVCLFYQSCREQGFSCTVSNRELNFDAPVKC